MTVETQHSRQQTTQMLLPAKLDVRGAVQLKSELSAIMEESTVAALNGSAVTKMSTAACQVIAAFIVSVRSMGGRAQVVAPSSTMTSAFMTLGLGSFLEEET